jgi:hypothetical protein
VECTRFNAGQFCLVMSVCSLSRVAVLQATAARSFSLVSSFSRLSRLAVVLDCRAWLLCFSGSIDAFEQSAKRGLSEQQKSKLFQYMCVPDCVICFRPGSCVFVPAAARSTRTSNRRSLSSLRRRSNCCACRLVACALLCARLLLVVDGVCPNLQKRNPCDMDIPAPSPKQTVQQFLSFLREKLVKAKVVDPGDKGLIKFFYGERRGHLRACVCGACLLL